jgi:hypothetical protein
MDLPGKIDIVRIGAAPGQEGRILAAADRLADRETGVFE